MSDAYSWGPDLHEFVAITVTKDGADVTEAGQIAVAIVPENDYGPHTFVPAYAFEGKVGVWLGPEHTRGRWRILARPSVNAETPYIELGEVLIR